MSKDGFDGNDFDESTEEYNLNESDETYNLNEGYHRSEGYKSYDPKYDLEHIKWDFTKVHTPHPDPLQEHMQYYTSIEKPWMLSVEDFLKREPTRKNMEQMIQYTDQYLALEMKNIKWWNDANDLYDQKAEWEWQRQQANPHDKVVLSLKINKVSREIKKHGSKYTLEEFREKYDSKVEEHLDILMYADNVRLRMTVGIEMWTRAAVREISAKYPDLQGTKAGIEIAPFLKQVNQDLGWDLTREEIERRYEKNPNPEVKKLRDAFHKADQEKKISLSKLQTEPAKDKKQSIKEDIEQEIKHEKSPEQTQKPGKGRKPT